jgi:PEP-CTERM motif
MKKALGVMLLAGMGSAHAATGYITVSGVINEATGMFSDKLGSTITASFYVSLDPSNATSLDTDFSDNPTQSPTTTAIYGYGGGAYNWTMSLNGADPFGTTNVTMLTENDYVELPYNEGQPFDVLTINGFAGTSVCSQAALDLKGYCDATDMDPGDAFEAELILAKPDWFSGTDLPGDIPGLGSYLGAFITANGFQEGVLTGEFGATITSMTVSASLAPIPEPETYAMLLAGLGLVGWAARQRKG